MQLGSQEIKRSKHSFVSYSSPGDNWLIKMTNMCFSTTHHWQHNIKPRYYHMHPLRYGRNASAGIKSTYMQSDFKYDFRPISDIQADDDVRYLELRKTKHYSGITILPECFWQHYNPAHFIFLFGVFYEWGISRPRRLPMFDRVALFKCSSWEDYLHAWDWGRITLEVVFSRWENVGLFPKETSDRDSESVAARSLKSYASREATYPFPHVFSPHRNGSEHDGLYLHCFDEIYLVQRFGTILSDRKMALSFREDLRQTINNRAPNTTIASKTALTMVSDITDESLPKRCRDHSLRISVQQRPFDPESRSILNLDKVLLVAKKFSSHVHSFSINHSTPLHDQIAAYNNFDILITMYGSHLTNLVFTNRTEVAVLEVGLAIRNWFWRENAFRFGIKHYFYNHVGNIPGKKCYDDKKVDPRCSPIADKYYGELDNEPSIVLCPPTRPQDEWSSIGDCSFYVNITIFQNRLQKIVKALCS